MKKVMIVAMALLLASGAYAQQKNSKRSSRGRGGDYIFSQLDLSSKQQEQLIEIKQKHRDEAQEIRKEIQEVRYEMMKTLEDDFDEAKAKKFAEKLGELHKKKMLAKIDLIKQVKSVLTEEQAKKMKLMRLWGSGKRGGMRSSGKMGRGSRGRGKGFRSQSTGAQPDWGQDTDM